MFVFTERGEVSVGGKHQPAHIPSCPCFLCSLIFSMLELNLLEHGGVFTVVSGYTCNCIVCWPCARLLFLSEHLCTPVCALLCPYCFSSLNLSVSELQSGRLPRLLLHFFFSHCLHVWYHYYYYWRSYVCFCWEAFWWHAFCCPQIRKLRRELDASQEKVSALTTQLSANVSQRE